MVGLPDWVEKQKRPGIEIRRIGDGFYAYTRTSKWDPIKKRPRKITGPYLGKITPQGLIPPKRERALAQPIRPILEHGNIQFVHHFCEPLVAPIEKHFPQDAETLLAAATHRLLYQSPLKNLQFYHDTTTSHAYWPEADLDDESLTALLRRIGADWGGQLGVFRALNEGNESVAIDLTQVFSRSDNIPWLEKGYNSDHVYHDQLQLLLLYSLRPTARPTLLKLLPGSLRDAPTLKNAVWEAGLRNVILVHDKGFTSLRNIKELEAAGVHYLAALKRNASFVTYKPETAYGENFLYEGRVIWARSYNWKGRRIIHFLDKELRAEEEATYFRLVEEGKRKKSAYKSVRDRLGTIALVTDAKLAPSKAYELYKLRMGIEQAFDAMKNTLESDRSYMRSREAIAGYFFIVFLALFLYASILDHLRRKELVKKYSVKDVLVFLSKIYKVRIGEQERLSEVPKKVRTLIEKLALPYDPMG